MGVIRPRLNSVRDTIPVIFPWKTMFASNISRNGVAQGNLTRENKAPRRNKPKTLVERFSANLRIKGLVKLKFNGKIRLRPVKIIIAAKNHFKACWRGEISKDNVRSSISIPIVMYENNKPKEKENTFKNLSLTLMSRELVLYASIKANIAIKHGENPENSPRLKANGSGIPLELLEGSSCFSP